MPALTTGPSGRKVSLERDVRAGRASAYVCGRDAGGRREGGEAQGPHGAGDGPRVAAVLHRHCRVLGAAWLLPQQRALEQDAGMGPHCGHGAC